LTIFLCFHSGESAPQGLRPHLLHPWCGTAQAVPGYKESVSYREQILRPIHVNISE
jgi:hypothetical protein